MLTRQSKSSGEAPDGSTAIFRRSLPAVVRLSLAETIFTAS
jgi:hypothetical protein